jgi:hypothetical protein
MSSFDIDWCGNFYGIYWAYEEGRLVVSTVFEDKEEALQLAEEVETWSDKFTRMTIIEKNNDEYAICCYQDPQISKSKKNLGLYRSGMRQASGYAQAKSMIEERSPLLQIAYAADVKCRIIQESDLKKQEYFFEKTAHEKNLMQNKK